MINVVDFMRVGDSAGIAVADRYLRAAIWSNTPPSAKCAFCAFCQPPNTSSMVTGLTGANCFANCAATLASRGPVVFGGDLLAFGGVDEFEIRLRLFAGAAFVDDLVDHTHRRFGRIESAGVTSSICRGQAP